MFPPKIFFVHAQRQKRAVIGAFSPLPVAGLEFVRTFSFDGISIEYLIGSASAYGTTDLSKPDVKLLTRAQSNRLGRFP